ncbi:hypothetical protein [Streptomyces sp. NPDC048641]|uniref:hypothetical protein n=1 Tax=Streptomyces sp. NPDC048641 TaxID=3154825 RepID=UPI0034183EDE
MAALAVSRREQLPFGELRAEQADTVLPASAGTSVALQTRPASPIGAREYDPSLADAVGEHARWAGHAASKNPRRS